MTEQAKSDYNERLLHALTMGETSLAEDDAAGVLTLLHALRNEAMSLNSERDFHSAQRTIQSHPVFKTLLEDPYTYCAFSKARGFAGDASLIDLFYGHRSGKEATSHTGRFLFEQLMRLPSCDAVRYRRSYYAHFIDSIAKKPNARILSLACGHLREALFAKAVSEQAVHLVGIDSDSAAIEEAQTLLSPKGVELRCASVVDFIRRKAWGEKYDAIYAAGLFDYLDARIAKKLLQTAYSALSPGGTISVANFLPSILERGYMDLVMDWRLIYRDQSEMAGLASELPSSCTITTDMDPLGSIVYLTILKA